MKHYQLLLFLMLGSFAPSIFGQSSKGDKKSYWGQRRRGV
jgi:hypothetical protein